MNGYDEFIARKSQMAEGAGFEPLWIPDFAFDFQKHLIDWSVRLGRAAILADCGMGKSPMELVWAENVIRKTNRPVLLLTPLAVGAQMIREGEKFGIEAKRSAEGVAHSCVTVTNYERLHKFNPSDFAGVVCDESGILKSFDGVTRNAVTEFLKKIPYRLLCTATPSPNDFIELGSHSEALGALGFMDMLSRFFKNNRNNAAMNRMGKYDKAPQWRFRGHAEQPFWRWVCSWARAIRKPSDFGFPDGRFALPPLVEREHVVKVRDPGAGNLFSMPAVGLQEEREERRRTLRERCEFAASLINDTGQHAVMWCHLNDEADLMENLIPDAIQVSGRDSDDEKEAKFEAFSSGNARVLVTKPVIGAWGLCWHHCAHMVSFAGHSFEQHYQSVRRFWRFGQERTVIADHVVSEGERGILRNLQRKAEQADTMFTELVAHMRDEMRIARISVSRVTPEIAAPWL